MAAKIEVLYLIVTNVASFVKLSGHEIHLSAKTRNIVGVKSNENIASGDGLLFWGRILKARVTLRIGNQNIILHSNKNVPNH